MKTLYNYIAVLTAIITMTACTKTEISQDPCYHISLRDAGYNENYSSNDLEFMILVGENNAKFLTEPYTLTLETKMDNGLLSLADNNFNPVEYLESWNSKLSVIYPTENMKPLTTNAKYTTFYIIHKKLDNPTTYQKIRFKFTYKSGEVYYSRPYILYIEKNPNSEFDGYKHILKLDLW